MLSRSCFDVLNLEDLPSFNPNMNRRIPRVMIDPGIISDFDSNDVSSVCQERRVIVSNQLPLKAFKDSESNKWCFEWDNDALVLQLKDGFPPDVEVIYVGSLKVEVDQSEQDEVAQLLLEKFRCVPSFLPSDIHTKFYHGFCKQYLWPLFHYMLPISPNHGARFDRGLWQSYVSANKIFADKVMEVINPDEDFVWVHDYHLLILPTFLRRRFHRVKLGFFLHSPFPSSEIYRTLPVRDEILKALLNSDLIGFHTFDYARHFLSCCSRMLGLDYESKRGYIGLDYFGRTVSIKILPVGVHMGQLQSVMASSDTAEKVQELKQQFEGKIVLLGIDDMDMFKGITLKFLALEQLLEQHPDYVGTVVLVQIANPARGRGRTLRGRLRGETHAVADQNQQEVWEMGYNPIVFINQYVPTQDKLAYYAMSECCVVNAVRDGMNLFAGREVPAIDEALGIQGLQFQRGVSSLCQSSLVALPSLSGAIRVNPWNIDDVSNAMHLAIRIPDSEKQLRMRSTTGTLVHMMLPIGLVVLIKTLRELARIISTEVLGVGFGLSFRVVALGRNFRKLSVDHIASAYNKSSSHLILLDYDGTMMPQASVDKAPSDEVILLLNSLCSNPKNVVFIVSGRGREPLSKWFSQCEKLGISAEHGYFTRWDRVSEWEVSLLANDF
ncbi:Glycosyl transferase, family 20 [Dillenia turbinata]|uniref:alpha,alpha-trehalose-phosphate synthase (UDP-forming) n=1 Tax=Dillenia turbinata TaxID=194707 RepID=A0AAN8W6P2_9MAGN